ncbi:MAG TPA: bifunctional (p)ppGpp synthetase/guanosine-3',5'-bis(diphosphate) 3'-pyrophosphohydrolase [Xanthomonadales bacterium]|nr:bifunctional (p)ppGpp synthetase/guanosine-3',5'-bis(diphosphate) 3'-pyrophosphohydrolase [Xanthomonadales bacterium]
MNPEIQPKAGAAPLPPFQSLQGWVETYAGSVGPAADTCVRLMHDLQQPGVLSSQGQEQLLELLTVLQALAPDPVTVCCAMLLAAEQSGGDVDKIRSAVPQAAASQLEELHKLKHFAAGQVFTATGRSAEGLRRLLLALVKDVRVVLIDLAWQLVQLRHARDNTEQALALAQETALIHAPLANRLGVWQLKWQLEDLAFRFREPEQYQKIAHLVAERRAERENFINGFMQKLAEALEEAGINATVKGRPKHIYSIWNKMQRKGVDFHQLFDVRAVRVLVNNLPDCYSALGLVHTLWQPIPGEFDDYITTPKGNNYQSLHTAVSDAEGRAVEVQIRTRNMHEHAELGVAAHWRYKEGGPHDPAFEKKIAVMRSLLEAGDDELDDVSLLDSFRSVTSEERVYVLTPRGQVVDLAAGSTVLDFAYQVHTEVGHRCRGAKVNGRIVTLTHVVHTGDRVEILTAKHPGPSRDWLNPRLGYIHGARARSKVRQWFKQESHDDNLRAGKEAIEGEAKRMGLAITEAGSELAPVIKRFGLGTADDLYVAVGSGDLHVGQVVSALSRLRSEQAPPQAEDLLSKTPVRQRSQAGTRPDDVTIEGVGNLMTTIARCCQPVPGDPVTGYITRGRGVTIHRDDCRQVLRWRRENNPRLLQVSWGAKPQAAYTVRIAVRAFNRRDLIRDISSTLAASDTLVTDISSRLDESSDEVSIRLKVRVRDYEQLSELLSRLGSVPNVLQASRLREV